MTRRYVAFEGIDGAGKTTVAARVAERLAAGGLRRAHRAGAGGHPHRRGDPPDPARPGRRGGRLGRGPALRRRPLPTGLRGRRPGAGGGAGGGQRPQRLLVPGLPGRGPGAGHRGGAAGERGRPGRGLAGDWWCCCASTRPPAWPARTAPTASARPALALQARVAEAYDLLAAAEPERFVVVDAAAGFEAVVAAATGRGAAAMVSPFTGVVGHRLPAGAARGRGRRAGPGLPVRRPGQRGQGHRGPALRRPAALPGGRLRAACGGCWPAPTPTSPWWSPTGAPP